MNSKKLILLGCVVLCVFAVPAAKAQMMGHGATMGRTPVHGAPMLTAPARTPMQGATMLNRASGFRRFYGFGRHDRFHHHINRIIVFDSFGFPFFASFPFYYPYPYYPYYPYGYYPYGCGYYQGYGSY